jgi:hypothetical protein
MKYASDLAGAACSIRIGIIVTLWLTACSTSNLARLIRIGGKNQYHYRGAINGFDNSLAPFLPWGNVTRCYPATNSSGLQRCARCIAC